MPAWKDLTGKKFGSLTVIKYLGKSLWLCECECGRKKPKNRTQDLMREIILNVENVVIKNQGKKKSTRNYWGDLGNFGE